jgi:hypothetical protein
VAHFVLHWLGLDSGTGPVYLALSGFASILERLVELAVIAFILLRRHTCHAARCWRIGRYHVAGGSFVVCGRHHPEGRPDYARIIAAHHWHAARHQPGPGEDGERLYDPGKDSGPE